MNKTIDIDNFIGIYDNFFSFELCDNLITYFEWCQKNNRVWARSSGEIHSSYKKDNATLLNTDENILELSFMSGNIPPLMSEFNSAFWDECYELYREQYPVLNSYHNHTIFSYKVQKTLPGEGYHIWHAEDGEREHRARMGVYILYLNDVEEGGETEFIYMKRRIPPRKGRLVIFPPNYPFAHRGNPPLSGEKYILTGWIEMC